MSSVCISNCINDVRDPRIPVRATYVNLYKWPESDAEFIRSVSSNGRNRGMDSHDHHHHHQHHHSYARSRVVDSISCRQMYLRSYKFSRKETMPEKTQKCFGRVKEKMTSSSQDRKTKKKKKKSCDHDDQNGRKTKCLLLNKVKEFSCAALIRVFQRFLSCTATVDVVE